MFKLTKNRGIHRPIAISVLVAAACTSLMGTAHAQSPSDELRQIVSAQLTPIFGSDTAAVVNRMLTVKIAPGLGSRFDVNRVTRALFSRGAVGAADCRTTTTAFGEADESPCLFESGKRDDPTGAYSVLSFSKNFGQGDIKFVSRAAFVPGTSFLPKAVRLTDADAYAQALKVVEALGVPATDIAFISNAARLPVGQLAVGAGQDIAGSSRTVIQKVVSFPKAFVVPGGVYKDPASGVVLSHVLAPGVAHVAMDDAGVQFARLEGWSDSPLDSKLDLRLAKSVAVLSREIADDLYNEGIRGVGSMSTQIVFRRATPNADDPNPPLCTACGVLRPALRVSVSKAAAGHAGTSAGLAIAGIVREYDLLGQTEFERPAR
jgi:hypothetical protein